MRSKEVDRIVLLHKWITLTCDESLHTGSGKMGRHFQWSFSDLSERSLLPPLKKGIFGKIIKIVNQRRCKYVAQRD